MALDGLQILSGQLLKIEEKMGDQPVSSRELRNTINKIKDLIEGRGEGVVTERELNRAVTMAKPSRILDRIKCAFFGVFGYKTRKIEIQELRKEIDKGIAPARQAVGVALGIVPNSSHAGPALVKAREKIEALQKLLRQVGDSKGTLRKLDTLSQSLAVGERQSYLQKGNRIWQNK